MSYFLHSQNSQNTFSTSAESGHQKTEILTTALFLFVLCADGYKKECADTVDEPHASHRHEETDRKTSCYVHTLPPAAQDHLSSNLLQQRLILSGGVTVKYALHAALVPTP